MSAWTLEDYRRWLDEAGTLVDESLKQVLAAPPEGVDLDRLDAVTIVFALRPAGA